MKWNAKAEPPVIEIREPELADKKEEIWFAIFPRKCTDVYGDKWVWLESYIAVYEFKSYWTTYEGNFI